MLIVERAVPDEDLTALFDAAPGELVASTAPKAAQPCATGRDTWWRRTSASPPAAAPSNRPRHDRRAEAHVRRPGHRGIARSLLKALEGLAAEMGYDRLRLATAIRRPEAIALHESASHPMARYAIPAVALGRKICRKRDASAAWPRPSFRHEHRRIAHPRRRHRGHRRRPTTTTTTTTTPLSWQNCGDGLQCAQIRVPADWARRSAHKVTIGLAKLPAQNQARKKGVLLVNTGGPGEQIALLRQAKQSFADLTKWFDVVIFDPRGFGRSSVINCPIPAPFATEWVFPNERAYDAYAATNRTFGRACAEEAGVLSGNLNSWQIAHDMEAIRKALRQAKLTYLGNSHGTVLGQAYAELFPRKVGRMYLDSVFDHTTPDLRTWLKPRAKALEANFHRFAAWCRSTATCALHGKDPVAVWDEVMAKARREPIPAPEAGPGAGISDTQIASRAHFTFEASWEPLAAGLARAQAGDASFFAKVQGAPDPDLSRVFLCADLPYPGYGKLKKLEGDLRRDTPHIGWRAVWPMANHCAGLPPATTYAPHPIKAPGLPPVLIAGGEHDDNTPTADGRRLAAQLPGARFLTAVGGHALYLSGHPCVREHVHHYLTTGRMPPRGASCGPAK